MLSSSTPVERRNGVRALRGVAVLFGGVQGSPFLCDTWEWNGETGTWTARSEPTCTDTGITAGRSGHSMAGFGDSVALFGGLVENKSDFSYSRSNELWAWNGAAWSQLCDAGCEQRGSLPAPRTYSSLVFAANGAAQSLFVFGGRSDTSALNDLWEFDLVARKWTERCLSAACRSSAPPARSQHGAAFEARRGRLFVHGGCAEAGASVDCPTILQDALEYDPVADLWAAIPSPLELSVPKHTFAVASTLPDIA